MVEYNLQLDAVFYSLSDPTRRDILSRLIAGEILSIGEIAASYKLTFAAISKHLKVLEKAKLIRKHRRGQQQAIAIQAETLQQAQAYLDQFEVLWTERYDRLDIVIKDL